MSINKFENDSLKQINFINEGLALGLLKFFNRNKVKKALKSLKDDPEFQVAVDDWNKASKKLADDIKAFKKRNPGRPLPWER